MENLKLNKRILGVTDSKLIIEKYEDSIKHKYNYSFYKNYGLKYADIVASLEDYNFTQFRFDSLISPSKQTKEEYLEVVAKSENMKNAYKSWAYNNKTKFKITNHYNFREAKFTDFIVYTLLFEFVLLTAERFYDSVMAENIKDLIILNEAKKAKIDCHILKNPFFDKRMGVDSIVILDKKYTCMIHSISGSPLSRKRCKDKLNWSYQGIKRANFYNLKNHYSFVNMSKYTDKPVFSANQSIKDMQKIAKNLMDNYKTLLDADMTEFTQYLNWFNQERRKNEYGNITAVLLKDEVDLSIYTAKRQAKRVVSWHNSLNNFAFFTN